MVVIDNLAAIDNDTLELSNGSTTSTAEQVAFLMGKVETLQQIHREYMARCEPELMQSKLQLELVKKENAELKTKHQDLNSSLASLKVENQDSKAQNDQLTSEKEALNTSLIVLRREHQDAKVLFDQLAGKKNDLEAKLNRMNAQASPTTMQKVVWNSTFSSTTSGRTECNMTDTLSDCYLGPSGVHTWKLKVHHAYNVRLGVIQGTQTDCAALLGGCQSSWGFGREGDAWHNGHRVGGWYKCISFPSIVVFKLDLTRDNGTLSVSYDGSVFVLLFRNMMENRQERFTPAVYCGHLSSKVELLELTTSSN